VQNVHLHSIQKTISKRCPKRFVTILSVVIMYTLDEGTRCFFNSHFVFFKKIIIFIFKHITTKCNCHENQTSTVIVDNNKPLRTQIPTITWHARTTDTNECGKSHGLFWSTSKFCTSDLRTAQYRTLWYHGYWLLA